MLWHDARLDLVELAVLCDGKHSHARWGRDRVGIFATAQERNYPTLLCQRWAEAVAESLRPAPKAKVAAITKVHPNKVEVINDSRVFRASQPRRRAAELVSQFAEIFWLQVDTVEAQRIAAVKKLGQRIQAVGPRKLEDCEKVLDVFFENGPGIGSSAVPDGLRFPAVEVGAQWGRREFVEQAAKLTHPYDQEVRLPPNVADTMIEMARLGPKRLAEYRASQVDWWMNRAEDLRDPEARLHRSLRKDVERVIADRQVLVFKEMLEYIGYDDLGVVDVLTEGVRITGTLPRIGIWRPEDRRAKIDARTLQAGAPMAQKQVQRVRHAGDNDVLVWESALEEVAEGCLQGPLTEEEVTSQLGNDWIPSRLQSSRAAR